MGKTLVVTNDFPPRLGGIETFVYELTRRLPPERLVVLTASMPGAAAFDAGLAFPVHRLAASTLLPTPAVARTARELIDLHRCDSVWFGAAATLGLLAPTLRSHPGVRRVVASTHGHERTWARVPAGRPVLRRIAGAVDCLTYISDAVLGTLRRALPPKPPRLVRLTPGVDLDAFASRTRAPGPPGSAPIGANPDALRTRLGVPSGPLVVCVSRLVALKGQDVLLRAWPSVVGGCPDATLLLVGKGPRRRALEAQVRRLGIERSVRFAGGLPFAAIPDVYAAADVAVLLTRPVAAGLVEEGLGAVTLEASASGLPVVVGRTGGAVETVQDGRTGFLVDPRDAGEVADRIGWLVTHPTEAGTMGAAGRAWMESDWSWRTRADLLTDLLAL